MGNCGCRDYYGDHCGLSRSFRFEEWERTGSDHRYHYLGSAIWFSRIGFALGDALVELAAKR